MSEGRSDAALLFFGMAVTVLIGGWPRVVAHLPISRIATDLLADGDLPVERLAANRGQFPKPAVRQTWPRTWPSFGTVLFLCRPFPTHQKIRSN